MTSFGGQKLKMVGRRRWVVCPVAGCGRRWQAVGSFDTCVPCRIAGRTDCLMCGTRRLSKNHTIRCRGLCSTCHSLKSLSRPDDHETHASVDALVESRRASMEAKYGPAGEGPPRPPAGRGRPPSDREAERAEQTWGQWAFQPGEYLDLDECTSPAAIEDAQRAAVAEAVRELGEGATDAELSAWCVLPVWNVRRYRS